MQTELPAITPGVIARELGEPLHRVTHVLRTRVHIRPMARGGTLRLYPADAIAQVRSELHAIDARRASRLSPSKVGEVRHAR